MTHISSDINTSIVGTWSRINKVERNIGEGVEHYRGDGTKLSEVYIFSDPPQTIKAMSKWSIDNNILTEEIISLDKNFSKKFKVKVGHVFRSYIQEYDEKLIQLKPLKNRKILGEVVYYRQVNSNH